MARVPLACMLSVALLMFGVRAWFAYWPTVAAQTLLILLTVLVAVCLGWGIVRWFRHWRTERWWTVVPLVACNFAGPLGSAAGDALDDVDFDHRRSDVYAAVVEAVHANSIPLDGTPRRLTEPSLAQLYPDGILAAEDAAGELTVVFLRGTATTRDGMESRRQRRGDRWVGTRSSAGVDVRYWETAWWLPLEWRTAAE